MQKPPEDDLFRESAMSFGEHLEELRRRLFRAIAWLAVGLAIGLMIGRQVVYLIESPLTDALTEYYTEKAKETLTKKYGELPPEALELFEAGYVPEQISVEPAPAFQSFSHAAGADIPWSGTQFPTYRIVAADVLDARKVAEPLRQASTSDDHASGAYRIWERLKPAERQLMIAIDESQAEKIPADQIHQLADCLNRLLAVDDLYGKDVFSRHSLDSRGREQFDQLVAGKALEPVARLRLNWSLMASVFPKGLGPPHPSLVSLTVWRPGLEDDRIRPKSMSTAEAFVIYMKASLLAGLILFSWPIFREIWLFVAAGLYPHERRYVYIFLPFSVALFVSGALLAFFAAFPPVLRFLFGFNDWLGITPDTRISEWLSFVLFLPLAFGIGFQLPLVMLFLNRIGAVSVAAYWRSWKVAIMVILIVAPIINPSPDPISFGLMTIPMIALYFGGILLCQYTAGRKPEGIGGE